MHDQQVPHTFLLRPEIPPDLLSRSKMWWQESCSLTSFAHLWGSKPTLTFRPFIYYENEPVPPGGVQSARPERKPAEHRRHGAGILQRPLPGRAHGRFPLCIPPLPGLCQRPADQPQLLHAGVHFEPAAPQTSSRVGKNDDSTLVRVFLLFWGVNIPHKMCSLGTIW